MRVGFFWWLFVDTFDVKEMDFLVFLYLGQHHFFHVQILYGLLIFFTILSCFVLIFSLSFILSSLISY